MSEQFEIRGNLVQGEIAVLVSPGTLAQDRDKAIDLALAGPLSDAANTLDAVLAAAPHRFVKAIAGKDGKDAEGRTRFKIRGRAEGGKLIPAINH